MKNKIYIIVLNYNNWIDTLECLESVLKNDYPNYQIVVVDNDSPNKSMDFIINWAEGKQEVICDNDSALNHLSQPFESKPLKYVYYKKGDVFDSEDKEKELQYDNPIIFIQSNKNGGFAAGNNIGIKYALKKGDFEYIWLLNNDTVIEPDALSLLVEKAIRHKYGIAGSTLMHYYKKNEIQAYGGHLNEFLGMSSYILDKNDIEKKLDFILGASFLIHNAVIKKIGLLPEEYFMYFEETDYCYNAKKSGAYLGVSIESVVYHKEGASFENGAENKERSLLADYFGLRNKIIFTKKYFPIYLIFVYFSFIGVLLNRIMRRNLFKLINQKEKVEQLLRNNSG